jgi:hypothetical protein
MHPVNTLRRVVHDADVSTQMLAEIREGVDNQSSLINRKLTELIDWFINLEQAQRRQAEAMLDLVKIISALSNAGIDTTHLQKRIAEAGRYWCRRKLNKAIASAFGDSQAWTLSARP